MKQAIIFGVIAVLVIGGAIYISNRSGAAINNQNSYPKMNELKIEDVKVGTGAAVKLGDRISVHYTGTFENGQKFDSSVDRGEPFSFQVGGPVIEGWNKGVIGMQVGGTRKLIIPPAMGYGMNDYGPIPGNSTLYFTIELLAIES